MSELQACDTDFFTEVPFESVVTEHSLYCKKGHLKQLMQSASLFVSSIVSSIFIMFQDKYGSKNILIWSFFGVALPGFVCVALVSGVVPKIFGISCLWVYIDIITIVASTLKNEHLVEPYRGHSNVLCRMSLCAGSLFGVLMTLHLRSYKYIVALYFLGYTAYTVLMMWGLPHSPSYLLKQNKSTELKSVVTRIAKINEYPYQKLQATLGSLDNIMQCGECF